MSNSPYLGFKTKQVYNEATYSYFFLIKHITKIIKSERHVRYKFVKLGVKKTIGHVNEAIRYEELESNYETNLCGDNNEQTPSVYDIKA